MYILCMIESIDFTPRTSNVVSVLQSLLLQLSKEICICVLILQLHTLDEFKNKYLIYFAVGECS